MIEIIYFFYTFSYLKAFGLFILFLERLDSEERTEVIDYYSKI